MGFELPLWTLGAVATIGAIPVDFLAGGGHVDFAYIGLYFIPFVWTTVGLIYVGGKIGEKKRKLNG